MPHSDTLGSTPARGSPRLFAACHVLPRLSTPRHPPDALLSLAPPQPQRPGQHAAPSGQQSGEPDRRSLIAACRPPLAEACRAHPCQPGIPPRGSPRNPPRAPGPKAARSRRTRGKPSRDADHRQRPTMYIRITPARPARNPAGPRRGTAPNLSLPAPPSDEGAARRSAPGDRRSGFLPERRALLAARWNRPGPT